MTAIRKGLLSELFEGAVAKRLTRVETISPSSNQHEFQGTKPLRRLFGEEDRKGIPTRFIWLAEEQSAVPENGFVSWGDSLFLALRADGTAMVIIAPSDSTMRSQLAWLFGMSAETTSGFEYRDYSGDKNPPLDYAARYILDELGVEFEEQNSLHLDSLLLEFGSKFPKSKDFSQLARTSLKHVSPMEDADSVLMAWIEREEALFRRLERRIVADRLYAGFVGNGAADVDGFLSFSLSVQNRRKSRAGQSLENQLEALFLARDIRFTRGAETENRNKPDFVFPSVTEYHNLDFPIARLTMLGAKSTLKDRWRQVLVEARRIDHKHLVTLEPGISVGQTNQMQAGKLQLVVPKSIQRTYTEAQQRWLLSVSDFLNVVKERQSDPAEGSMI